MKPINLDDILLSAEAYQSWLTTCKRVQVMMHTLGYTPNQVPDEQARILRNGNLKIYIKLPIAKDLPNSTLELSMVVASSHWSYRNPKN